MLRDIADAKDDMEKIGTLDLNMYHLAIGVFEYAKANITEISICCQIIPDIEAKLGGYKF